MIQVQQPTLLQNSSKLDNRLFESHAGNYNIVGRPADLQIGHYTNQHTLAIFPGQGIYLGADMYYVIWINGVNYYLPTSEWNFSDSYGINRPYVIDPLTQAFAKVPSNPDINLGLGGMLDNSTLSGGRKFLLWAVANDANTAFLGFGATAKPVASFTAISNGDLGSSNCTLTLAGSGLNQASRFSVGAKCVVRNTSGTAPTYQWCQGRILSITDNQTLVIQLENNVSDGSVTVNSATGGVVEQFDNFQCFNGNGSVYATAFYKNARLIGEFIANGTSTIRACRSIHDEWYSEYTADLGVTVNQNLAGTGTTTMRWKRLFPPWIRQINTSFRGAFTAGFTQIALTVATVNTAQQFYISRTAITTAQQYEVLCLMDSGYSHTFSITPTGTPGTSTLSVLGYTSICAQLKS